jgi:hypothetical protein
MTRKPKAMPMAIVASDTVRKPRGMYWMGTTPMQCDICQRPIDGTFIDGATSRGPWATMDPNCHEVFGRGLGTGRGQRYERQPDSRWLKVEG